MAELSVCEHQRKKELGYVIEQIYIVTVCLLLAGCSAIQEIEEKKDPTLPPVETTESGSEIPLATEKELPIDDVLESFSEEELSSPSSYVELGEEIEDGIYSFQSDGQMISKEQAVDLVMQIILREYPEFKPVLMTEDPYFGSDYYGYMYNVSWAGEQRIEHKLADTFPEEPSGGYYTVRNYEDFGDRQTSVEEFAVVVRQKIIVCNYWMRQDDWFRIQEKRWIEEQKALGLLQPEQVEE
ncbi:hypothetical protein [Bacilliculturomica massiliensis]|uniref:hypothetical protein n=1 Tax=Bacilliculturomica massiliensis TaxID=1917867 RepID=UPI001031885E|nr:hypothetical protein [Bacilliculturomica massiliensis]